MKLKSLLISLCCISAMAASVVSAAAGDRRVALVIGNAAYKTVPTLANTVNDANAISDLFQSIGFEVVVSRNDLGVVEFKRVLREFLTTAEGADIAVVYYAGHGVEMNGTNYLIPVDAKLTRDYDVEDEAVSLDRLIWALQSVKRLRLILLDACRDNPFSSRVRSAGLRSLIKGGLGKIDDVSADTLVAYAAKAGSVSYDGNDLNSPYATSLLRRLTQPGIDIRIALGKVRDDVVAMTGGRQEPFIYGSLGGDTISLLPASPIKNTKSVRQQINQPVVETIAPAPSTATRSPSVAMLSNPSPTTPPPATVIPQANAPAAATIDTPLRNNVDQAQACARDEPRLVQLRANPAPDEVLKFRRELTCVKLESQVKRLLESVAIDAAPPSTPVVTPPPAATRQAQAQPLSEEAVCARDAQRLSELRADPSADAISKFAADIGCERIRPQLQRLRESLGL